MKKITWLILISFVLGYLITYAIQARSAYLEPLPAGRKKELIKNVYRLEEERKHLKREIATLEKNLKKIEESALKNQGLLDKYKSELKKSQVYLGLLAARGPGVEIVLSDSISIPAGADPNNYLIHDYDLRVIVNALLKGGAEGIAINNQRLIFNSTIRCVGATIMVNSVRLVPPYNIKAIGSPSRLLKALEEDEESTVFLKEYVPTFGLQIRLKELKEVYLPSYNGPLGVER